jgi:DNA-binding beta-propeller fold protein YncE
MRLGGLAVAAVVGAQVIAIGAAACAAPEIASVRSIIGGPSLLDTFRLPTGLAADAARGIFLVADTGNHRIVVFDSSGRSRGAVRLDRPAAPGVPAVVGEPRSIAVDGRGRIYVIDGITREIEVLSSSGAHLAFVQPPLPPEAADSAQAQSIAVGRSGRLYLLFAGVRPGLVVMEPAGAAILTLGFDRAGEGPFLTPASVAVNADETEIAVVDPEAERPILVYGADGTPLAVFGRHGTGEGTFSLAVHAAWGPGNTLWIADTIRHSVSVFDDRGIYLGRVGGFGDGPGQFNYPAASAFLAPDRLVVLERAGDRCQILEVATENSGAPTATSQTAAPDGAEPPDLIERR